MRPKARIPATLACIGLAVWLGATAPLAGQRLRVGQGVSIDVGTGIAGVLRAHEVEVLRDSRSLSLRGRIEAIEADRSFLEILGVRVRLDSLDTEVEAEGGRQSLVSLSPTLAPGAWVEVKAKVEGDGWVARSVNTYDVKPAATIKGTIAEVRANQDSGYVVVLEGVPINISQATDFATDQDDLIDELFGELKSDDELGEDSGYRLAIGSRVFVSGSIRSSGRLEDSFSLQEKADDYFGVGEPSARLEVLGILGPHAKVFAQLQTGASYELYRSDDAAASAPANSPQTRLRQFYVAWDQIAGRPAGLVAGKLRAKDEREFLFDEYLDGLRLYAYGLRPLVLEASVFWPVAPLKDRFQSWRDVLLQARVYPNDDWHARAFTLVRFDQDTTRNRDSRYVGVAVDGRQGPLKTWGSITALRGQDKGRAQKAYAWDLGLSARARALPGDPSVMAGVAVGTGDRDPDDEVSNDFRQTGYQDNSSRLWGLASFKHFGEVVDPELTNLRIASIGVGLRPHEDFSIDLVAHRYRQDRLSTELDQTELRVGDDVLDGEVGEVGTEFDLIMGAKELFGSLALSYKLGAFVPGKGFDQDMPPAILHRLEFRLDF